MDKGLAEPIRAMLASFEVDALTKIPTAQYDLVAAQLRALGAQI
jgi:hypothetical protein